MDGLTVSYGEYNAEQKARREAEAEVTRLRVLLSGQAARITALSSQGRRDELHRQLSLNLRDTLSGLGQDVAKLKAERDVALVEIEEIASSKRWVSSPWVSQTAS
jgi:Rho-type GTPase-activating protein 1/2